MLILSLDTSSAAGSAALVRDGRVVVERPGDPSRTHAERLPRELMELLEAAGATLADVDQYAVVTGPGSFTGLRIGIASIQGLAFAARRLVVPVSAFEAFGWLASGDGAVATWIDAHRGQVFAELRDRDGATVIEPPTARPPAETLRAWSGALGALDPVRFVGDGALKYRQAIDAHVGSRARVAATVPPLAGAAGQIAAAAPGRAVRPHAVVPLYVRRPDAELARDRRAYD
jgi:tRNA threonylcarbamoyladenosine biosynthesis protein TsaB